MQSVTEQFEYLIWGGYGWGNTGDEICLAAAVERLRRRGAGALAILTPDPEYTSWLHPDVPALPCRPSHRRLSGRWKKFARHLAAGWRPGERGGTDRSPVFIFQPEWAPSLARTRRLYLCGGGYLTDFLSLEAILPPILLAAKMGLPIETAPIGIGPFKSDRLAQKIARALGRADLKVRDEVSLAFCRLHGLRASLEPDDAFAWAGRIPSGNVTRIAGLRSRKIGICLFSQYGAGNNYNWRGWWAQCLRELKTRHPGVEIKGFSFHASPHYEFRETIRIFSEAGLPANNVLPPLMDFRQAAAALGNYDFIISARFHAIVLANVFGIPNAAIATGDYYLSKMKAAIRHHENFSRLVNPNVEPPEALLDICRHVFAAPACAAPDLRATLKA